MSIIYTKEELEKMYYFDLFGYHRDTIFDYEVLAELRSRRRDLLKCVHPDYGFARSEAIRVNEAKSVLDNEKRRTDYKKALVWHGVNDGL